MHNDDDGYQWCSVCGRLMLNGTGGYVYCSNGERLDHTEIEWEADGSDLPAHYRKVTS